MNEGRNTVEKIYDLVILGCGPAGLSAAINATIRNKEVVVMGTEICSPPLHKAQVVDNYLGLPAMKGKDLLDAFQEHAEKMGVKIMAQKAETITEMDGLYLILLGEDVITSRTIVIATGVPYKPTLPQEDFFLGKGLGYCATCDGPIYRGKDVLLIGHSDEAEHEANFMAEICNKVYYIPLYKKVGSLDSRVQILDSRPDSIIGTDFVEGLKLKDGREIAVEGLFVLGGETAPDRLIPGLKIEKNHIIVNRQQETNLPGVYAAGDCTGPPYQVAKSVGEGQVAGLNAAKYASKR
ncbi:MAG: NAD(P)/FAD-dependent oxidoreductase [Syntrophomonadaceae bacterium]|nr:NAD(P)/FAD-dependent oxidoreductase [Syntrophomonadaceae bacterium]